jgi:hypothetical protein
MQPISVQAACPWSQVHVLQPSDAGNVGPYVYVFPA